MKEKRSSQADRSAAEVVARTLDELAALAREVAGSLVEPLGRAAAVLEASLRAGGKVLACGNGGSAADAQHFVAELVGRYGFDRAGLPAVALSVDTSVLTAVGNDYGFEEVFARQVAALGRAGDVLVGISTSGQSPNVLRALETARERGLGTIALVGAATNSTLAACDVCLNVPSAHTPRVQEMHIAVLHILSELVEQRMFGGGG